MKRIRTLVGDQLLKSFDLLDVRVVLTSVFRPRRAKLAGQLRVQVAVARNTIPEALRCLDRIGKFLDESVNITLQLRDGIVEMRVQLLLAISQSGPVRTRMEPSARKKGEGTTGLRPRRRRWRLKRSQWGESRVPVTNTTGSPPSVGSIEGP